MNVWISCVDGKASINSIIEKRVAFVKLNFYIFFSYSITLSISKYKMYWYNISAII